MKGKNIVVTGANRGIGKAVADRIAMSGGNVWACMREISPETSKWIEELSAKHEVWIEPVQLDLRVEDSIKKATKMILEKKVPIDGIVNVAGITGPIKMFSMMSMEEIRETFEVNFFGTSFFTQRLIKNMMRNKKGSIVNISSIAAIDGEPAQYAYVASKAAVIGASKKLSIELAPYHIRVNVVAPGIVETDMGAQINKDMEEKILSATTMRRKGNVNEIADVVSFLLSNESAYITGQVLRVDGGKV